MRVESVETLHHKNVEMPECQNAKNTFWCRFRIPGVGVSKHFITRNFETPKCEIPKYFFGVVNGYHRWSCEREELA
jgi:hypothetical protein